MRIRSIEEIETDIAKYTKLQKQALFHGHTFRFWFYSGALEELYAQYNAVQPDVADDDSHWD